MSKSSSTRLRLFTVLALLAACACISVAQDEMKVSAEFKPMYVPPGATPL